MNVRTSKARWPIARACLVLLTLTAAIGSVCAAQQAVQQPRQFGYFIGDVLTQQVALPETLNDFSRVQMPPADRLNTWFERIGSRITRSPDGRHWLTIDTQIINSPETPQRAEIPALTITLTGHEPVHLPARSVNIAPLTVKSSQTGIDSSSIQPDRPAMELIDDTASGRLQRWLFALALVLAGWMGWLLWRNQLDRTRLPFEKAWQRIRPINDPARHIPAWQHLHRAFDQTAGHTVRSSDMDQLFQRAPFLAEYRGQIEQFFAHSDRCFFADEVTDLSEQDFDLRRLSSNLRDLEKRSSR